MKPVIKSVKHYVQVSLATVLAGAKLTTNIVDGVPLLSVSDPDEVPEGSVVRAVFIEMWIRAGDTSPGSTLVSLYKTSGGLSAMSFAESTALHTYDNKKNILYHTQGLTNDQNADAIPFIRQWFKIPKGKQRFGLGDTLRLNISAQALDNIVCGFMTYKSLS